MNNIIKLLHATLILMAIGVFAACGDNEKSVTPSVDLSSLNFKAEPGKGEIKITWDKLPETPDFMYMTMTYTDPRDGQKKVKTISPYSQEITIPQTRARFGDAYSFAFTPYSPTKTAGKTFLLDKCHSLPAEATVTVIRTPITIEAITTNAQEPTEGPLANLTDGNKSTFFHTAWSQDCGPNHWITVDMGQELDRFEIVTINRSGARNNFPNQVKLYRLNSMNDNNVDIDGGVLFSYQHPSTQAGAECSVMYPAQDQPAMKQRMRYLRYLANGTGGSAFWHLAEFSINKVTVKKFDPETDE